LAELPRSKELVNVAEVGKDCKLEDVDEIESFTAIYADIESSDDLIWFVLELDPKSKLAQLGYPGSPVVALVRDGKTVATVPVATGKSDDPSMGIYLEWRAGAEFDESSQCVFCLNPQTEEAAYVTLPFKAAKSMFADAEKKVTEMSFAELRKKAIAAGARNGNR
jgi:hypothetical protein